MAQSRRASRRNATVNGDASSEVAEPESAGVVGNGGHVEEDGDATVEESEVSAVRSKEQTTLGVEADAAGSKRQQGFQARKKANGPRRYNTASNHLVKMVPHLADSRMTFFLPS